MTNLTVDTKQKVEPVPGHRTRIDVPTPEIPPWRTAFNKKWQSLHGTPGNAVGDAEPVAGGYRQRYEDGKALFADANLNVTYVYGEILKRYEAMGGPTSWLGFPTSDEQDMSESGRANTFEHGTIYFWSDVGAIDLSGVILHYTGLICFGTLDNLDPRLHDFPYGVIGVLDPTMHKAVSTRIYDNTEKGDRIPDLLELFRGQPVGMQIAVQLMNHGMGGSAAPQIHDLMEQALEKGAQVVADEVGSVIPVIGPPLAKAFGPLLVKLASVIADALTNFFAIGDSDLGHGQVTLTAKDMVLLAARTQNQHAGGIGYKFQTNLISKNGASYKLCFGMVPMAPL